MNSEICKTPCNLDYRISKLDASHAAEFYRLRLMGLELNPGAFGEDAEEFKGKGLQGTVQRLTQGVVSGVTYLGAWVGDTLVGHVGLSTSTAVKMRHRAHIWGVFVDPAFQRKGIGSKLMCEMVDIAKASEFITQLDLGVNTKNREAIALYTSVGFQTYGTDPGILNIAGVYEDEYLMILNLR